MIEIKGKNFCENCFEEITGAVCQHCGHNSEKVGVDPTLLAPGSVLLGKYVIGSVIGKGGFGVTYLAYDSAADKKVAVKEYFPYGLAMRSAGNTTVSVSSSDNLEAFELGAEKFYNEAKLVSKFNGNPNIVNVYEFFYENDTVYLAMEYLHGHTLKEHIRDRGNIGAPQAMFIAQNVLNALEAAHGESVLHRDISPDNIIICDNGGVKLIDFGAARQVVAEHSQSFSIILKPGFAPLEQYNKKGNQGPWSDIYSLGATLYFALTGDIPEDSAARFDDDDTFKENLFEIDPALWNVITKATKLRAEDRYRDVREMRAALDETGIRSEPIVLFKKISSEQKAITQTPSKNYKQHISFASKQKNTGFFGRHKRIIISACCLVAVSAAVAVPLSLNRNDPNNISDVYAPATDISDVSAAPEVSENEESASSQRITDSEEDSASGKFVSEYISPTIYDYKSKVLYNTLSDDEKALYEILYSGIENAEFRIAIPQYKYMYDQTVNVYNKVLYDNPQISYVQDFTLEYNTDNSNEFPDERGYAAALQPEYSDSDSSRMNTFLIKDLLALCEFDGDITDNICKLHDMAVNWGDLCERGEYKNSGSVFRALCNVISDDIGHAQIFNYCAQSLGVPSYIVEGTVDGKPRAWCRVKLDGAWYNVDIYADRTIESAVTELEVDNGKRRRFRTFFLVNDEFIKKYGYVPYEEYEFIFDEEYAANSTDSSYYFQTHKQYDFYTDPDAAYEFLLEASAKNYNEGTEKTSCYVPPLEADKMYGKLDEQYLSDLEEKYGITPAEYSVKYYPDEFVIALS